MSDRDAGMEERRAELKPDPRETNAYALQWLLGILVEFLVPVVFVFLTVFFAVYGW